MKKLLCIALSLLLCLCAFSCSAKKDEADEGKIKIVATLFPQYDFAREIVGDKAQVQMLLPLGIDSHSFDPSMKDASKVSDADIFIYTGDVMENWARPFAENAPDDCTLLDVSQNIAPICLDGHDHSHEEHSESINVDPHIWTSPENAKIIVCDILDALVSKDPENADYYTENAQKYLEELEQLDKDIEKCVESARIDTIYFGGKFAFRYFAQEYGLSYVTLYDSCSESAEPDPKTVTSMISEMNEKGVKTVLYPELSDDRAAQSVADGTGGKTALFHSCHNLSKEEFEGGKTYISIMYENLSVLEEALS